MNCYFFLHLALRTIQKKFLTNKWTLLFIALIQTSLPWWSLAKGWKLTMCENFCFPAQDGFGHPQKHHKYLHIGVSKLGPSRSSRNSVIFKLNNGSTDCSHLVLPGEASFTGRKFHLILIMKLKFEIIQICTITYISLLELSLYYSVNHV